MKNCKDDTALLKQCLEALSDEWNGYGHPLISALRERLKEESIAEKQLAQKFGYTIPQAPDSFKYDENGCDRS